MTKQHISFRLDEKIVNWLDSKAKQSGHDRTEFLTSLIESAIDQDQTSHQPLDPKLQKLLLNGAKSSLLAARIIETFVRSNDANNKIVSTAFDCYQRDLEKLDCKD